MQRHRSPERPIFHQISSLMYPKIQQRRVIMNVLHLGCERPPRWSPPVLWRRFEDGLAWVCRWIYHWVWPVKRQTYGYLPSRRASPPLDRSTKLYCFLTGTRVRTIYLQLLPESETAGTQTRDLWDGRDSNPRPLSHKSNALIVTPPAVSCDISVSETGPVFWLTGASQLPGVSRKDPGAPRSVVRDGWGAADAAADSVAWTSRPHEYSRYDAAICTQGEVMSQSLWSLYGRHFEGITRHNELS